MQTLKCPHCGFVGNYDISEVITDLAESYINCYNCIETITLITEGVVIENTNERTCSETILPVLEEGDTVVIINEEHPWNGEIALICGTKHRHYRIELHGKKVWVPFEWVESTDDSS